MSHIKQKFNKINFFRPEDPSPWGKRPESKEEGKKNKKSKKESTKNTSEKSNNVVNNINFQQRRKPNSQNKIINDLKRNGYIDYQKKTITLLRDDLEENWD